MSELHPEMRKLVDQLEQMLREAGLSDLHKDPAQRRDPRVSPIHAKDLAGLAPAFILTAEFDPLRDEAEAYGQALAAAGVAATTRRYNGVIHGFFGIPTENPVPEVLAAFDDAIEALQRAFGEQR